MILLLVFKIVWGLPAGTEIDASLFFWPGSHQQLKVKYWLMVSAHRIKLKIDAIATLSSLLAELSLRAMWYTTCCIL